MTHTQTQGADGAGTKTGDLNDRLRAAGMFTVPEMMGETPLTRWQTHAAMTSLDAFEWWLDAQVRQYLTMKAQYEIGDKPKDDELYEWVLAHSGAFHVIRTNFRVAKAATPAPAATPGVPDSVRALSEAATQGRFKAIRSVWGFILVAEEGDPKGCLNSADADFAVAAVNHVRALIAAQPAGQGDDDAERCIACDKPLKAGERVLSDASGGVIHTACCGPERESYTGADGGPLGPNDPIPQGYVYEGEQPTGQERPDRKWVCNGDPAQPAGQAGDAGVDVAEWKERLERAFYDAGGFHGQMVEYAARTALPVLLAAIKSAPDSTRTGDEGTESPSAREIVSTWDRDIAPGLDRLEAIARRMGAPVGTRLIHWAADKLEEFGGLTQPAPNSTRTGAAETEDAVASAIEGRWTDLIGPAYEGGWVGWKRRDLCREFAKAALAARPEAPSDAGWSREDLEAFVAREWPEGRSAGAAARELVRALGARGLAPTLQRLLTDLLGQINFASTDRAQILADFANAAPEAARMAKIDSFERWNPRVFDPTPPSDPAPSGQAEG